MPAPRRVNAVDVDLRIGRTRRNGARGTAVAGKQKRSPTFAAMASQAKLTSSASDTWRVVFFKRHSQDDSAESVPGQSYLAACPKGVRAFFRNVIAAVAAAPPTKFAGGGYWEAMKGDMTGYFETRKKLDGLHYRLFCRLDEDSIGTGPLLVILTGMTKPDRTTFTATEYGAVKEMGEEYLARNPRSII
jgi:hypothetical protein